MPFLIVNEGLEPMLEEIRAGLLASAEVGLYTNTHAPAAGDNVGVYTEPVWVGYARVVGPTWSAVAFDGNIAFTEAEGLTYLVGSAPGAATVQGYFVTDSSGTLLLFAESFAGPVTPTEGVDMLLTVRFRFRNP